LGFGEAEVVVRGEVHAGTRTQASQPVLVFELTKLGFNLFVGHRFARAEWASSLGRERLWKGTPWAGGRRGRDRRQASFELGGGSSPIIAKHRYPLMASEECLPRRGFLSKLR